MKKFLTEEEVFSKEPQKPKYYKLRVFALMNLFSAVAFLPTYALMAFLFSEAIGISMEFYKPMIPLFYFFSMFFQLPLVSESKKFGFEFMRKICGLELYYDQYQEWSKLVDEYNEQQVAKDYIKKYSDYQ